MEINRSGNWDHPLWTEDLKKLLQQNLQNVNVGEHVVYENDVFKIWPIHLPAGGSLPFHRHCRPYFYVALSAGRSRSFYGDGRITESTYESGSTAYYKELDEENFFIHNLQNIGDNMLIFSTVEFKTIVK